MGVDSWKEVAHGQGVLVALLVCLAGALGSLSCCLVVFCWQQCVQGQLLRKAVRYNADECLICMERRKNTLLRPCGHMVCDVCYPTLKGVCAECRVTFTDSVRVDI